MMRVIGLMVSIALAVLATSYGQTTLDDWELCEIGPCLCNQTEQLVWCNGVRYSAIVLWQFFPPDTRVVWFENNEMQNFESEFVTSKNVQRLEEIRFISNPLTSLAGNGFTYLPRLESLEITGSSATSFQEDILTELRYLKKFELNSNTVLTTLPECLFMGLKNLTTVRIYNSPVLELPQRFFFSSSTSVVNVAFDTLTATAIPDNIFDSSPTLRTIAVRNCSIAQIDSDTFDDVPQVQFIDLSSNLLTLEGIPDGSFDPVAPVVVDLRNNPLLTALPRSCDTAGVTCLFDCSESESPEENDTKSEKEKLQEI